MRSFVAPCQLFFVWRCCRCRLLLLLRRRCGFVHDGADEMHVARSKDHSDAAGYARLREVSGSCWGCLHLRNGVDSRFPFSTQLMEQARAITDTGSERRIDASNDTGRRNHGVCRGKRTFSNTNEHVVARVFFSLSTLKVLRPPPPLRRREDWLSLVFLVLGCACCALCCCAFCRAPVLLGLLLSLSSVLVVCGLDAALLCCIGRRCAFCSCLWIVFCFLPFPIRVARVGVLFNL